MQFGVLGKKVFYASQLQIKIYFNNFVTAPKNF